jgi:Putative MetA-pathway of phenol degradation
VNTWRISQVVALFAMLASSAFADISAPSTQPATEAPDKSPFNLSHPTPGDQLRSMDTDRPNITNTPHTIDAGHLQIETGVFDYMYYRDHSPGDNVRRDDFAFGEFNFRLGVLNNLEINAVVNTYDITAAHDYDGGTSLHAGSFGDTVIGAKLNLWGDDSPDETWVTALAVQPQFKLPTASDSVGNGRFEFEVPFPFLMNLPEGFHLGLQPGVSYQRNSTDTGYVTGFPSAISLDRVLICNIDVYLEYACDPTDEPHAKTEQTIDVGGTYPLNDNVVLDTGLNFGMNSASPNIEWVAGISIRI